MRDKPTRFELDPDSKAMLVIVGVLTVLIGAVGGWEGVAFYAAVTALHLVVIVGVLLLFHFFRQRHNRRK